MTKVSRRKPGIKARAVASVGAAILGATLSIAIGCCKPAEAAPVVLEFTGVASFSSLGGVNDGDPITFKVFADNGGSSLISQTWDSSNITAATMTAGSYSATTSGPLSSSFGGFTTNASGLLASLQFAADQNGTDSNGHVGEFLYYMNGLNNIWFTPANSIGAVAPPDITNTSIALVAATPIPAALPLFASALGGLGFVGWRRRRAADAG